jgi:hypothetical protein
MMAMSAMIACPDVLMPIELACGSILGAFRLHKNIARLRESVDARIHGRSPPRTDAGPTNCSRSSFVARTAAGRGERGRGGAASGRCPEALGQDAAARMARSLVNRRPSASFTAAERDAFAGRMDRIPKSAWKRK